MTVAEKLKSFPPILVRLLARRDCEPLSTGFIAATAGLPKEQVEYISQQTDWREVKTLDALHFLRGCGLAIDDTAAWRRALDYLSKRPTFRYLRSHDYWETYYEPMLKRWVATYYLVPGQCPPVRDLLDRLKPVAAIRGTIGEMCG